MGLGGEKNLAAALAQGSAVIVEAAGVGRRRVAVGYSLVERAMNDGDGLSHAAVRAEYPFAAQGKLRHLAARLSQ